MLKTFLEKITFEIMPQIQKTRQYISDKNNQNKINELNLKIDQLQDRNNNLTEENIFLDKKYRFKPSTSGYLYIISISYIKRGKKILCYKYGVTDDMDNRYRVYLVGNPNCKLLYYVPLDIDKKILEVCINNLSIIINVHILDEGIDIPQCDSVYITQPNNNIINIVQRMCRANKITQNKKNVKYIYGLLKIKLIKY